MALGDSPQQRDLRWSFPLGMPSPLTGGEAPAASRMVSACEPVKTGLGLDTTTLLENIMTGRDDDAPTPGRTPVRLADGRAAKVFDTRRAAGGVLSEEDHKAGCRARTSPVQLR